MLAIVGPTASGKSALALELAQRYGAELVSCDSMQIYRGCDIGSAKPTPAELASVPHHLIDVATPDERYSAARYITDADAAVATITQHQRPIIFVGGTGLYLRAFRYGLVDAPPHDEDIRQRLEEEERVAPGSLHQRLAEVDPRGAELIGARDLVRLVRSLEVYELTGTPLSTHHAAHGKSDRYPLRIVVLDPPMDALTTRIAARVEHMLRQGLIEETRHLIAMYGANVRPLSAVGYAEVAAFLDGKLRSAELADAIVRATRQYARRQRTWFRKEPNAVFYESAAALLAAEADGLPAAMAKGS